MNEADWPLNVPVLSDGIVTLRAHHDVDIDRAVEMANDPAMQRWTAVAPDHTRAMSERFHLEHVPAGWNDGTSRSWAVEFEGRYAGNVDIRGSAPLADIGYALHPDCRGRGLMARAVRLAVDHAFTNAGIDAIQWTSQVGNVASLRVAWACGFRLHATVPDLLVERGLIHDGWIGSIRFGDAPLPRTPWHTPTIEVGKGIVLRATKDADLPRWAEAESSNDARRWFAQSEQTVDVLRDRWHRSIFAEAGGEFVRLTVADRDDRLLGSVSIFGIDRGSVDGRSLDGGTAEIGYFLHPDATGTGVMTRAVEAATRWAFSREGLDVHRMSLGVADGNEASRAVAQRAHFTECGRRSRYEPLTEGHVDLVEFERLR